ncbi:unnamed protein product [Phytophthora lilii]|uniref:Unnamed protein product n=1 Tax=Phytophthora lilii TaxID=2077276 RepID=A0A9W6TYY0_9STRA|nr:unnamed protein product [Phytophthora lilii]
MELQDEDRLPADARRDGIEREGGVAGPRELPSDARHGESAVAQGEVRVVQVHEADHQRARDGAGEPRDEDEERELRTKRGGRLRGEAAESAGELREPRPSVPHVGDEVQLC